MTSKLNLANCQWINNKSVDFYKFEYCPYIREGDGSTLGASKLTNCSKSTFSFLVVITQHIKELLSRNFSGLLNIIC